MRSTAEFVPFTEVPFIAIDQYDYHVVHVSSLANFTKGHSRGIRRRSR